MDDTPTNSVSINNEMMTFIDDYIRTNERRKVINFAKAIKRVGVFRTKERIYQIFVSSDDAISRHHVRFSDTPVHPHDTKLEYADVTNDTVKLILDNLHNCAGGFDSYEDYVKFVALEVPLVLLDRHLQDWLERGYLRP